MLKAHVCLGRKISRDYNSTNYAVSIEADIPATAEQPDEVQKHIHRLFQLAEKSLDQEIDRDQGEQSIGRRDQEPSNGRQQPQNSRGGYQANGNGQGASNGQREESASQKQINYIHNLAKRQSLSKQQLEGTIRDVLGQIVAVDQLTKKEAGRVIEHMANATTNGRK